MNPLILALAAVGALTVTCSLTLTALVVAAYVGDHRNERRLVRETEAALHAEAHK